jgi:hypothetical protein
MKNKFIIVPQCVAAFHGIRVEEVGHLQPSFISLSLISVVLPVFIILARRLDSDRQAGRTCMIVHCIDGGSVH